VASSWGATLYAALIIHDPNAQSAGDSTARVITAAHLPAVEAIETELARGGADKIVVALCDVPVAPLWASVGGAWQGILDHLRPRIVLFGADGPSAAELGPRTGARIGARLLVRARSIGIDDVELRDGDGGYARASDGGAVVALVGRADPLELADEDIDLVVLEIPSVADARVEVAGAAAAEASHAFGVVVALGEDVAGDAKIAANAQRLAGVLGAAVITSDRPPAMAPELCVTIGAACVELAGGSHLVQIGGKAGKHIDGALPDPIGKSLTDLLARLDP
jgi:hypothetical protein